MMHTLLSVVRCRPTSMYDLSVSTHCQAHPSWVRVYWF